MSKISLSSNILGTGTLTIASPNTDSDATINLPTVTGGEFIVSDASGNVGIGTGSPDSLLTVQTTGASNGTVASRSGLLLRADNISTGFANSRIQWTYGGLGISTKAYIEGGVYGTDYLAFSSAGSSESMRIDSSGNLLVGTASYVGGEARLTVVNKAGNTNNPVAYFKANATTIATTMLGFYDGTDTFCGQAYIDPNSNTTIYATSSDYRLKENVAPMTGALERVSLLKPCTYTWKKSGRVGEGFIAHELADVCPAAVVGEKDAVTENGGINPQMIDTSFLVATLTAAIQEQQAIIESLTARVVALEGQA